MLTGKDVHEAFRQYDRSAPAWDLLSAFKKQSYEAVAQKLNATYIAPLQGNIETLQAQNDKLIADMKALRDLDRKIFDKQEQQISELKKLGENFVKLLTDDNLMIEDSTDGWYENRDNALLSAHQLLKEQ